MACGMRGTAPIEITIEKPWTMSLDNSCFMMAGSSWANLWLPRPSIATTSRSLYASVISQTYRYGIPLTRISASSSKPGWVCSSGWSSSIGRNSEPKASVDVAWVFKKLWKSYWASRRRRPLLCLAAKSEMSNRTDALLGGRDGANAMTVSSLRNQGGGSKVLSGPTIGSGRKQFESFGQ